MPETPHRTAAGPERSLPAQKKLPERKQPPDRKAAFGIKASDMEDEGYMEQMKITQEKVYRYMERWDMLAPGMRVLAGFSGGADSTALLELLWEYGKAGVRALHVHHGIRGAEADRDQAFCERFCRERGIPLKVVYKDVPRMAKEQRISMEEAGRKARYEAFEEEWKSGRADRVALAHHQDDQAETMLFHLMRGTGLRGLRGMEPVRMPYIRPLLCVGKEELRQWLTKRGTCWIEDSTNQECTYMRNRIRHQVLAPMEEIRPGSAARMAAAAGKLLEAEDFLDTELERCRQRTVREQENGFDILLEPFRSLHPYLKKQLVLWCLKRLLGDGRHPEEVHVLQVCALTEGRSGSRVTLPDGCFAVLGYRELWLQRGYGQEKNMEEVSCEAGQEYCYMGARFVLSLENREKIGEIPVNRYTKWFDYDRIEGRLVLRTRRPGDYLELSGGMRRKLKNYFIDSKVPAKQRDQCILLADGSHVLWITGMRISERVKVTEQTERILKVQMIESKGAKDGEIPY